MVEYKKLKDGSIKLTDSQISILVDKHFQDIQDLLAELKISATGKVRALFGLNEVSDALKYLLKCEFEKKSDVDANSDYISPKEHESIEKLHNIIKFFSTEDYKSLDDILEQYGEKVKEQDLKSINVFKAIKLFFQDIIAKFKGKSLEDFNDEHTLNTGNSKFYCDTAAQTEPKQESHPEEVLEEDECPESISRPVVSVSSTISRNLLTLC